MPSRALNLIYGDNGAGKSSLLEAIAFISRAKSFRTNLFRRVIQHEFESLTLFAEVGDRENSPQGLSRLGIEKKRSGEAVIRIDGDNVNKASDLALKLPLLVLNNASFDLLGSGAKERRQFFDWLVFHVKHGFADAWKQYNRLIKHRNSLLRHDRIAYSDLYHWDVQLVKQAMLIQELRKACVNPFASVFRAYIDKCDLDIQGKDLTVRYTDGWKQELIDDVSNRSSPQYESEFLGLLKASFEGDRRLGYTSVGPHRSELKITVGRANAGEILSRGQQKILITAMFFSKAEVYRSFTGKAPVILIDDLPSELDKKHQDRVVTWLHELESQTFIAGIERQELEKLGVSFPDKRMFHVKHGNVEMIETSD